MPRGSLLPNLKSTCLLLAMRLRLKNQTARNAVNMSEVFACIVNRYLSDNTTLCLPFIKSILSKLNVTWPCWWTASSRLKDLNIVKQTLRRSSVEMKFHILKRTAKYWWLYDVGAPTSGRYCPVLSGSAKVGSVWLSNMRPPNMTLPLVARNWSMRRSTSGRKWRIRPWIGQAAASPRAQMVRPSICLLATISISKGWKS